MIPELRRAYNASYTNEHYSEYRRRLEARGGMEIPFRLAETPVFLVASPSVSTLTGQYFADRRVKPPSREAQDPYTARRLYDVSVKLAGLGTE